MRPLALALVALLSLASAGCRRSMAPVCRQMCVCTPCTQLDLDTCVDKGTTAQDVAVNSGCGDAFDALIDCYESNISCRKNGGGPGTDQCAMLDRALVQCDGQTNPFGSACDEATLKLQTCTGAIPDTPNPPILACQGVTACVAACELAAPCEVLANQTPTQSLTNCLTTCEMKGGPPPPHGD